MFDVNTFDLAKYDSILSRGLSSGLGESDGQMCIEAAICATLGLPHGDDPECVASSVRSFKIALNDQNWSSPQARAEGLYDLGIAQLGSKGVVGNTEFRKRLSEKIIRQLIPKLFREVFPTNEVCLNAVLRCETEGTSAAAYDAAAAAYDAADAANAANAAAYAANAANDAANAANAAANAAYNAAYDAANAANAAANAANAAANAANAASAASAAYAANAASADSYRVLAAKLALEVLIELESPGTKLLGKKEGN